MNLVMTDPHAFDPVSVKVVLEAARLSDRQLFVAMESTGEPPRGVPTDVAQKAWTANSPAETVTACDGTEPLFEAVVVAPTAETPRITVARATTQPPPVLLNCKVFKPEPETNRPKRINVAWLPTPL